MSLNAIGTIGIAILVVLMILRMPIFAAMALIGFVGFSYIVSPGAGLHVLSKDIISTSISYGFSVIPLFILMGNLLGVSGVSRKLYYAAYRWIGHFPGGLAMATIWACAAFGAICGSQVATAATIGIVAIPEMRKYRYDLSLATGSAAAGGLLGGFIPPSVPLAIYGIMAGESIGKLFVAGIMPGILIGAFYTAAIVIITRRNPLLGPAAEKAPWREKLKVLASVWETLVLFILVIGGLFAGFFTPTEAAGIGAGGALLLGLIRRNIAWQAFKECLFDTLRTSCMVMIILVGATTFSHFLIVTKIPLSLASWVGGLNLPTNVIMLAMLVVFIFIGCWMETLPVMIFTIPVISPVCAARNIDPIWFGVFLVVALSIGMLTPPVAINAYTIKGIAPDVPLGTIFKGLTPFTLAVTAATVVMVFFPGIVTFLPNLLSY
jgi:tripartite ATP-independent transporter DctM subunit